MNDLLIFSKNAPACPKSWTSATSRIISEADVGRISLSEVADAMAGMSSDTRRLLGWGSEGLSDAGRVAP